MKKGDDTVEYLVQYGLPVNSFLSQPVMNYILAEILRMSLPVLLWQNGVVIHHGVTELVAQSIRSSTGQQLGGICQFCFFNRKFRRRTSAVAEIIECWERVAERQSFPRAKHPGNDGLDPQLGEKLS